MPQPVQYVRQPFVRERYAPNLRFADLIRAQGQDAAESERRQGDISAQLWGNLANIVGGIPQQIQQQKAQQAQAQQQAQQTELQGLQIGAAKRAAADTAAMDTALGEVKPGIDPDVIEATLPGHLRTAFRKSWNDAESAATSLKLSKSKAAEAEADYFGALASGVEPFLSGEDGGIGAVKIALQHAKAAGYDDADAMLGQLEQNPGQIPQVVQSLIQKSPTQRKLRGEEADRALKVKQEDRAIKTAELTAADRTTDNLRAQQQAAEAARHNAAMEAIGRMTAGRAQAAQSETERHNRAMEENARNTKIGRPVIDSTTQEIADFDTSLDDLAKVRETIAPRDPKTGALTQPGATGTVAKIGASLPNWVTSPLGWNEPKQRQATIDRVKQVIGKVLEGGVLRKEDERKYEKILPTIADDVSVVETKLNGLEAAITQRKGRRLDALEDAGYNVTRYRERGAAADAPKVTGVWGRDANGKLVKQ